MNQTLLSADRIFHLVADIAEFLGRDVFQAFAASVEVFIDFERRFLHDGVRIFTSPPKEEILALRDSGLIVILVETQAEQSGRFFWFLRCFHS